jgi:hypothetical protein
MLCKHAWSVVVLCIGLALLCGCPPQGAGGGKAASHAGVITEPGIDFHRKNIGMPVTTLDYIGDSPLGVAGARDTGQVFFAVDGKSGPELYVRDAATLERRFLGQVPELQQSSLAVSADGKYMVFCRQREREKYIEDPKVTYPKKVAVVTRQDVATGKEESLFDFRTEPFLPYRNDQLTPVINRDGSFVAVVSYNMERLTLTKMLSDWLALEADLRTRAKTMPEAERKETEVKLRQLLNNKRTKSWLEGKGVTVAPAGTPTEAEREAIIEYYDENKELAPALLLWENGEARVLPIIREQNGDALLFIVAAEPGVVLLWPQPVIPDPLEPQQIFRADLSTGKLQEACSFLGTPSTFELSQDKTKLLVVNNPTNIEAKQIETQSNIVVCSIDSANANQEISLEGDYLGYVDIVQDGRYAVGQDQDGYRLMLYDTQTKQESVQLELENDISGIFLDQNLQHAIFMEAGILYAMPLSINPTKTDGYIDAGYFDQYKSKFTDMLTTLGFVVPADLEVQYEERWGLNTHEISAQITFPTQPDKPCLMRYSFEEDKVVALWLPQGYPVDSSLIALSSTAQDYYEIKATSESILNTLGWLNPDTRTLYQPGPNPLYDGRTDSYILLYRDGYWLDEKTKDKWVINSEVTMRIHGSDGALIEMSISETDPIHDQPLTMGMDQILFRIRNNGEMPIPEDAPIRFDTENLRYVIDMAKDVYYGPAKYELGQRQRLCYEIDAYITPENELIATYRVDTETGDVLGQLDFQPSSLAGLQPMGAQ